MEPFLSHIFAANIFLVFIDATVGYFAAPALCLLAGNDASGAGRAVLGVRRLLALVVALYMFFNCLAYFDHKPWLLYFTSAVLLVDIVAQLIILRRMTGCKGR